MEVNNENDLIPFEKKLNLFSLNSLDVCVCTVKAKFYLKTIKYSVLLK